MAVKPLHDNVLVKQCDAEVITSGGIVLPDSAQEKPQRGIVSAVGPGKLLDSGTRAAICLKKGDEIFYAKYAGSEVKIGDEDYVILRESDVLAILS